MKTKSAPSILLDNIRLCYGEKLLFERISMVIEAGQFTCLLGPSGVGKTSLLRLLAGLIPEQNTHLSGSISTCDALPLTNRIAYLAQNDLLLPWLSALENVVIGEKLRGQKPDFAKAQVLLERVGLSQAANLMPNQLSGGMRQRVALARTLFENRPIVLMDEPFAALDSITRFKLQELAAELLAHCTVLLVTHDPLEALRLGQTIFIMAGEPVRLTTFEKLPSKPPRKLDDPLLLQLQAILLTKLNEST